MTRLGCGDRVPKLAAAALYTRRIDILFCCTGNMCRSPMAEGLFRRRAEQAGIPALIASCGLLDGDRQVPAQILTVMDRRGVDLRNHVSQPITPELVRTSHLILGMERQHVREAVVLAPGALARSFTFRDFVWRALQVGPRADAPLPEWLDRVGEGRTMRDLLGTDTADEVPDPMGQSMAAYEASAEELDRLVDQAFAVLFDTSSAAGPDGATAADEPPLDLTHVRHPRARADHPVVPDAPTFGLDVREPFAAEGDQR